MRARVWASATWDCEREASKITHLGWTRLDVAREAHAPYRRPHPPQYFADRRCPDRVSASGYRLKHKDYRRSSCRERCSFSPMAGIASGFLVRKRPQYEW